MAHVVEVRIKDNGTFMYLKGISKRTKKILPKQAEKLAKYGAREIKKSARQAKIRPWTGRLYNSISARRLSRNSYGVFIPFYGNYLDSMPTHIVPIRGKHARGIRYLRRWANDKGIKRNVIRVKPHPFIERGYMKMVNRANIIAKQTADKIVRG